MSEYSALVKNINYTDLINLMQLYYNAGKENNEFDLSVKAIPLQNYINIVY